MQSIVANNIRNTEIIGKNDMTKTLGLLQNVNILVEKGKTEKNENMQFVGKKSTRQRKTDGFL